VQRVIWAALLMAVVFFCVMAFIVGQKNVGNPFAQNFIDPLVKIIYAIAIVTYGVAFFMRARLRDMGRPPAVYNIVGWALLESITIYGLVVALIHADWRLIAGPAVLTLAGYVITFPREE